MADWVVVSFSKPLRVPNSEVVQRCHCGGEVQLFKLQRGDETKYVAACPRCHTATDKCDRRQLFDAWIAVSTAAQLLPEESFDPLMRYAKRNA